MDLFSTGREQEVVDFEPTPIEKVYLPNKGEILVKRGDKYLVNGVAGGKVRSCYALALKAKKDGYKGLTTAGSRSSPQVNIVAHVAQHLHMECHIHTPQGELSQEVLNAIKAGGKITQHRAGYNSVIVARSREDAKLNGFYDIPFGMECDEAIFQNSCECLNLPYDINRIVVPIGSGMSVSGILWGLKDIHINPDYHILGVQVGADPIKRLDMYAPSDWRKHLTIVKAGVDYHDYVDACVGNIHLDPVYEAKCVKFLQGGDLFWIIGCRQTYL